MSRLPHDPTPRFGLLAWLEQTRIELPLKGVECRFDVTASLASVEIDQIFYQSHRQPLDCTYTFPLPAGAAVYRCEMHVNGRIIRAKVEAQADARRIFDEQKTAGYRAALVETERDNLFTLSLGNLQPDDVIVLRFAYFQTLERAGRQQRLRIPVCPGVRYVPGKPLLRSNSGRGTADDTDQVPDASRISPPRIDALHPDAAYFSAAGLIACSDVAENSLSSPTHPLLVSPGLEKIDLALALQGTVPDRDFIITWQEPVAATLEPRAWMNPGSGETYALVQLRAPAEAQVAEDFEQDVYFLVDRSGSMQGAKWAKTCEALTGFVRLLGQRDRVWITLFESAFSDFAEAPLPASRVLADPGFQSLVNLGVAGGTELRPAAAHVFNQIARHSTGRRATVVLITDGQVGNEDAVLSLCRAQPQVTVHAFGIDTVVNDAFLQQLTAQQGGACWLLTPADDISGTVSSLADRLRRPVLTDLTVGPGWEPANNRLPSIHAGSVVEIALRRLTDEPLTITGQRAGAEPYLYRLTPALTGNPALPLLWARRRIDLLQAENRAAEALTLAKQHNLLCKGAAFIAWDEAEKVLIAEREVYQPSLEAQTLCSAAPRSAGAQPGGGGLVRYSKRLESMESKSYRDLIQGRLEKSLPFADRALEKKTSPAPTDDLLKSLVEAGLPQSIAELFVQWATEKWLLRWFREKALRKLAIRLAATPDARPSLCLSFLSDHFGGDVAARTVLAQAISEWIDTGLAV